MNDLKLQAADWLLKHGESCLEPLKRRVNNNYKLLPDFAQELFEDAYKEEVFKTLKKSVMESLNVNPEEIGLFFTKDWVIMCLSNKIFSPEKI